jgi:hypothetical protein
MEVGDRILAPPLGQIDARDWIHATVVRLGKRRDIRDPSDGSTRPHQPIHVRYDDGGQAEWDLYFLERRQS